MAALKSLPGTTECEIIKNEAIINELTWAQIRDKAVTVENVVHPNTSGFEKLIGIRRAKDVSDCSTESGGESST